MIDELIDLVIEPFNPKAMGEGITKAQALTAIYEIGLQCIGADIKPHKEESLEVKSDSYLTPEEMYQNDLKASQRKAWAKACGVAK